MRTRRILAAWQREGLTVRLIDVRLAPFDHWRGERQPCLLVLLEGLDDRLEPTIQKVEVEAPRLLEDEMTQVRDDLVADVASRTELLAMGASGTIDQLAVNALAQAGDLAEGLRRVGREWRFWLEDDTAIMAMRRHVSAGSGDPAARVQWTGDWMCVEGLALAPAQLRQAVGKPASSLFDHPFLSPDMTVLEAETAFDDGRPRLQVKFVHRRLAFCSASGRVWEIEEGAAHQAHLRPTGDNVVQFMPRRPAA